MSCSLPLLPAEALNALFGMCPETSEASKNSRHTASFEGASRVLEVERVFGYVY